MLIVGSVVTAVSAQPQNEQKKPEATEATYVITSQTVVHDKDTDSNLDNYVTVHGSEVLRVQYAESLISTLPPGASNETILAPGTYLHLHTRYGRCPQEPDVGQVPPIGRPVRACEMNTKIPDNEGQPVIAIQTIATWAGSLCTKQGQASLQKSEGPSRR